MTDKELLELAAKAAGYDGVYGDNEHPGGEGIFTSDFEVWNPLYSDEQAFRLAVNCLGFYTLQYSSEDWEYCNHDGFAATRRAIVRAAAEIGKERK